MINKTAYIKGPYKVKVENVTIAEPSGVYVLIEVMACALCGGDISSAKNNKEYQAFGHEIAGVVRDIGDKVSRIKIGDRVTIETTSFCGECYECRNGQVALCANREWYTQEEGGGFSQYVLAKEKNVLVFDALSFQEAALIEPLGVAMDLVNVGDVGIDDHVLIVGLGSIGLMALQLLKYRTAGYICGVVSSKSQAKLDLAKKFSVDDLCYYDIEDVKSHKYPVEKFDRILVTSPPETISQYIDLAAFGGKIVYLGFAGNSNISFDANKFHINKLTLTASFAAPAIYFPRCIEFVKRGKIDLKSLITHEFTVEQIIDVIAGFKEDSSGLIKAVMYKDEKND